MKKKTHNEVAPDERLALLFKETALGADLDDIMADLVPPNDPWWGDLGVDIADTMPPSAATAANIPWRDRISAILNSVSDWALVASRYLELEKGNLDAGTRVFASSGAAKTKRSHAVKTRYRTWRQGDLRMTLRCEAEPPFQVVLHIDQGPDAEVQRICWVDEASLSGDPGLPPALTTFAVKRIPERKRTYHVAMPVGQFSERLRAINTAEDGKDPHLLLPFVEME